MYPTNTGAEEWWRSLQVARIRGVYFHLSSVLSDAILTVEIVIIHTMRTGKHCI